MWLPAVVPKSGSGPSQNSGDTAAPHVLEAGFSGASRTTSTVCRLLGQVPPNPAQNGEGKAHTYAKAVSSSENVRPLLSSSRRTDKTRFVNAAQFTGTYTGAPEVPDGRFSSSGPHDADFTRAISQHVVAR